MKSDSFDFLDKNIRKVPDFPKAGIIFYDVTSLLKNPAVFGRIIDSFTVESYTLVEQIEAIAAIESRGFVFGAALACKRKLPLILIRKKGKLPNTNLLSESYALEYGSASLEINPEDVPKGNILLIDDLIATQGSTAAAKRLIERAGGTVTDIFGIIGLPALYKNLLGQANLHTMIEYNEY